MVGECVGVHMYADMDTDLATKIDQSIERELTQLAPIEIRQTRLSDTEILGSHNLRPPETVDLPTDRSHQIRAESTVVRLTRGVTHRLPYRPSLDNIVLTHHFSFACADAALYRCRPNSMSDFEVFCVFF